MRANLCLLVICVVRSAFAGVPAHVILGPEHAKAAVILLHGLGDSGRGLSGIASSLMPKLPYVRFIFPTAESIPITMNMGANMRAWFDLKSLSSDALAKDIDEKRIKRSAGRLLHIVQEQVSKGIPRDHIVVGGFSQGAVVSLFGTFYSDKFEGLGGCISLSGFFPPGSALVKEVRKIAELRHDKQKENGQKTTPVLMVHGTDDNVVAYNLGKKSYDEVKSWSVGEAVTFYRAKGMGHSINEDVLARVGKFLKQVLPGGDDEL